MFTIQSASRSWGKGLLINQAWVETWVDRAQTVYAMSAGDGTATAHCSDYYAVVQRREPTPSVVQDRSLE